MDHSKLDYSKSGKLSEIKINWAKPEEVETFAKTVKHYRQDKISHDDFRRFRLQHGAYGSRMTEDYSMVRIKIPAGEIHPRQLEKIADLSEYYSIGSAHVSTRQNIQLHWVILEDVSEVMRGLAEVGLTTREACGNTVRNVMCSPLANVCPNEEFDPTPYAIATAKFLLRNPLCQSLPRKFKINYTCCDDHGMARIADIGLIPQHKEVDGKIKKGFKVFLGGGLGNWSSVGYQLEEFTPEDDLLYTILAVIKLFDRLGNRKNMARNRLRYLVNEMGWEKFRSIFLKKRQVTRTTQSIIHKLDVDDTPQEYTPPVVSVETSTTPAGYSRWLKTNTLKQKQDGFRVVFLAFEAGDITSNHLRMIAQIAREFSAEGKIRNGFIQNMALRWVAESELPRLYSKLVEVGLAKTGALTMASPIGCTGTTSCNLAITNSHRLAKEIQRKFLELGLDNDEALQDSSIKISGCPNSCGQHEIATIGFYGGGGRSGKDMYPLYTMQLGGRADGQARLGATCTRMPAKRVIPAILKIIEVFKSERKQNETLSSWIQKIVEGKGETNVKSVRDIKNILEPLTKAPLIKEDKDFFMDYGTGESYHVKTGKGECAA